MSCATPLAMNSGEIVEFRNSSCSLCHAQFKFCMQWCKLMADFKAFSECTKKDNNSANPSNTSFQHVPSSYGFFPHQSSYGVGPSHMFDTTTMTHHLPIIQDLHHQCHSILRQNLPNHHKFCKMSKVIKMKMMMMMNHNNNNHQDVPTNPEEDQHVELKDINDCFIIFK